MRVIASPPWRPPRAAGSVAQRVVWSVVGVAFAAGTAALGWRVFEAIRRGPPTLLVVPLLLFVAAAFGSVAAVGLAPAFMLARDLRAGRRYGALLARCPACGTSSTGARCAGCDRSLEGDGAHWQLTPTRAFDAVVGGGFCAALLSMGVFLAMVAANVATFGATLVVGLVALLCFASGVVGLVAAAGAIASALALPLHFRYERGAHQGDAVDHVVASVRVSVDGPVAEGRAVTHLRAHSAANLSRATPLDRGLTSLVEQWLRDERAGLGVTRTRTWRWRVPPAREEAPPAGYRDASAPAPALDGVTREERDVVTVYADDALSALLRDAQLPPPVDARAWAELDARAAVPLDELREAVARDPALREALEARVTR